MADACLSRNTAQANSRTTNSPIFSKEPTSEIFLLTIHESSRETKEKMVNIPTVPFLATTYTSGGAACTPTGNPSCTSASISILEDIAFEKGNAFGSPSLNDEASVEGLSTKNNLRSLLRVRLKLAAVNREIEPDVALPGIRSG